jgi:tetratricopeptide (TPR) repeat protein
VFEYLCKSTEHRPDGIDGLAPLYQAIPHGCHAGLQQRACDEVYRNRILRGARSDGYYSTNQLGAIGADLGAVASFFDHPWSRLPVNFTSERQAWLFNEAANCLRGLGRLNEAVEPMRASLEIVVKHEDWRNAAIDAGNLSELELTLGDVSAAIRDGERIIDYTERSPTYGVDWTYRASYADARHQGGERDEAGQIFADLETTQSLEHPQVPRLYSLPGFRYCDLLLSLAERPAWHAILSRTGFQPVGDDGPGQEDHVTACDHVTVRAKHTLAQMIDMDAPLLTIALDNLTLARAALYRWLASSPRPKASNAETLDAAGQHLGAAVDGLRGAGQATEFPRGLLTRAWWRQVTGDVAGAVEDLDEAWEIAERGSMKLHQTDVLLTRARLGLLPNGLQNEHGAYPWGSPRKDLDRAATLIQDCGYHRRDEELADAQAALACHEQQQGS